MSTIEFKDLNNSIGTELFTDAESFLEELGEDAENIIGGLGNMQTTAYRETTHYRPTEHDFSTGIRSTIILHQPHPPRHPRPIHPVRYPRPIHPIFTGNETH